MPVTIRDVARKLNLSITTVSRALDGYEDVAEETRDRVVQTAHEMGYTPNRAARQLRRQRTDTIGYILPADAPRFADPFYSEFIAGLGDAAAQQNYDLLVASAPPGSEAEQASYQRWLEARKVDGIVLNRIRLHDWRIQHLSEQKMNFVCLERSNDPVDYPSVEVNGQKGVAILVHHLVTQGHRRIAYVGAPSSLKLQANRLDGYIDGLESAGIEVAEELIAIGNLTSRGGYQAAQQLLSLHTPPTAVVCVNDLTAIGVMHAIHEHGLSVGKDLAVAGFDGNEDSAHTQPPLTTVNQPVYDIALKLVQMLLALINDDPLEEWHVQLQPELILRASTERFQHG